MKSRLRKDSEKCTALCENTYFSYFYPSLSSARHFTGGHLGSANHLIESGGTHWNPTIINLHKEACIDTHTHTHTHTQVHTLLLMKEASWEVKGLILPILHKRGKATDLFNGIWVVQGCYGHLKGCFYFQDMKVTAMK